MNREDAIQALVRKGHTREQAEAFLALLGSGLARRGWAGGPVLSDVEVEEQVDKLVGPDA